MGIELKTDLQAQTKAADTQLEQFPSGFSWHFWINTTKILPQMLLDVEALLHNSRWKRTLDGTTIVKEPLTGSNVSVWLLRR